MLPSYRNVKYTSVGMGPTLGRWRVVLALMALTLFVCFIMFSFLPENSLRQPIRNLPVGEFLIPNMRQHHRIVMNEDIHLQQDRARLGDKIQEVQLDVPEQKSQEPPQENIHYNGNLPEVDHDNSQEQNIPRKDWKVVDPDTQGVPHDEVTRKRREKVKEMTKHAWSNYVKYAWGENELKPISKQGHSAGIFGTSKQGATIVDGMDTLYIMGLRDEFAAGREWIANHLDIKNLDSMISVFETNIRFVGGLLTLYAFTDDSMFKKKADDIAEALLPAFDSPTGIPYALINPKTQKTKNYAWSLNGCSILAEFGTMHLEFDYLSEITKKAIYRDKIMTIRRKLVKVRRPDGLYPNYLNPKTGLWGQEHISMGALGDSFYEYLFKAYVKSDGEDVQAKELFLNAMDAIEVHLMKRSEREGMLFLSDKRDGRSDDKMDHLTCFVGGLFALASTYYEDRAAKYLRFGTELTSTCHQSYNRTDTGLGPEVFRFSQKTGEARAIRSSEKYYILRPEVIESYFYLWRVTKDPKYREWGWQAVLALEKYCRTDAGFSGIENVYQKDVVKDDVQQSFFLAETLKYLYLLFSEDDLLPLDKWVFNTEAHPFPIRNKNPIYRRNL